MQLDWKKWRNAVLLMAIAMVSMVLVYLLMALGLGVMHIHADRDVNMAGDVDIYLLNNGVHTDIVMPIRHSVYDWQTMVNPLHTRAGQPAEYVGIGWGDKGFYLETPTWSDLRASTAIKAITGMSDTAMHVTFFAQAPLEHADSIKIRLTALEYERLVANILPSFRLNAQSQSIPIPNAHYHHSDAFYEANGTYHLFYTCNTWVNQRLKKSGLKAVVWTPFSSSLMNAYR